MNIYDIKAKTQETSPYYFSRDALNFFGQTVGSFKVKKQPDGRYMIKAPIKINGQFNGNYSVRYFNPINNELELN